MSPGPKMTRPLLVTLLAVGLLAGTSVGAGAQESPAPTDTAAASGALATPEDAVAQYLAAVAAGDVDGILAVSAADQMAAGFQFAAYVERLGALDIANALAPADYPFYARLNEERQEGRLLNQVQLFADGLLSGQDIDGSIIVPADAAWAEAFTAAVDPARLSGIMVEEVRFPDPAIEANPRYQQNAAVMAAIYGADEQTERLALFSFEGAEYQLGFTLLRYGDEWLIASQTSPLAGTTSLGTAAPTTRAEYDALTGG